MNLLKTDQLIASAEEFGTPLYIYHTEKITEQFQKLKSAFNKENTTFFYACKALTNINILAHIKSIGVNIDCSSINEVRLALLAEFSPENILYTSNGINYSEILAAKQLGVHITMDSFSNLEKFAKDFGESYPISIRIRPNIMGGGNLNISTGHDNSKFGIPITQLKKILELQEKYNLNIEGLHIHTGSDIADIDIFLQGISVLFDIIHHFPDLVFIDLGSGFKVKYKEDDKETELVLLANKIYEAFDKNEYASKLQIWFEPGKFLVSECGYLITKVNVLKENNEITFVGVDTGFNHLLRPMFYNSYHHIKNISNTNAIEKNYAVVGNLCETDTFAWERKLNEVREGDLLCIYNTGAYGFEMSSNYNSRFKPAEIMFKNNIPILIRERDEFNDLIKKQIKLNQ